MTSPSEQKKARVENEMECIGDQGSPAFRGCTLSHAATSVRNLARERNDLSVATREYQVSEITATTDAVFQHFYDVSKHADSDNDMLYKISCE